jgi:hypothetical protein
MLVTMLFKWVVMFPVIIQHSTLLVKKSVPRVLLLYTISYFVLHANWQVLQVMLSRKTGYVIESFLFDSGDTVMYLSCIKT